MLMVSAYGIQVRRAPQRPVRPTLIKPMFGGFRQTAVKSQVVPAGIEPVSQGVPMLEQRFVSDFYGLGSVQISGKNDKARFGPRKSPEHFYDVVTFFTMSDEI